jgi:hypothetical protein
VAFPGGEGRTGEGAGGGSQRSHGPRGTAGKSRFPYPLPSVIELLILVCEP